MNQLFIELGSIDGPADLSSMMGLRIGPRPSCDIIIESRFLKNFEHGVQNLFCQIPSMICHVSLTHLLSNQNHHHHQPANI